ncbi:hypothetical protein Dimus_012817 [Dionaea muscipula]
MDMDSNSSDQLWLFVYLFLTSFSVYHRKIQGWMETYPKKASIIRLVGEGDWLNQFRAVVLIKVSPFPYM